MEGVLFMNWRSGVYVTAHRVGETPAVGFVFSSSVMCRSLHKAGRHTCLFVFLYQARRFPGEEEGVSASLDSKEVAVRVPTTDHLVVL